MQGAHCEQQRPRNQQEHLKYFKKLNNNVLNEQDLSIFYFSPL